MYLLFENILNGIPRGITTEIISSLSVVGERLLHSNQDCTRAIMQQF
jgi:hypothetical protein